MEIKSRRLLFEINSDEKNYFQRYVRDEYRKAQEELLVERWKLFEAKRRYHMAELRCSTIMSVGLFSQEKHTLGDALTICHGGMHDWTRERVTEPTGELLLYVGPEAHKIVLVNNETKTALGFPSLEEMIADRSNTNPTAPKTNI